VSVPEELADDLPEFKLPPAVQLDPFQKREDVFGNAGPDEALYKAAVCVPKAYPPLDAAGKLVILAQLDPL
jgi:hypothetical protein